MANHFLENYRTRFEPNMSKSVQHKHGTIRCSLHGLEKTCNLRKWVPNKFFCQKRFVKKGITIFSVGSV